MTRPTLASLLRTAFWAALLVAYICAIMPGGPEVGGNDKLTHFLAFGSIAGLARLAFPARGAWRVAVALLLFGIFIELSQAIPLIHRDAELRDVLADAIGIAGGLLGGSVVLLVARRVAAATA